MEPWYRIVTRPALRGGRSFCPDEFALEQVPVATAPRGYRDPEQFCARTCFTRALQEHSGRALRWLSGKSENTALDLAEGIRVHGGGR